MSIKNTASFLMRDFIMNCANNIPSKFAYIDGNKHRTWKEMNLYSDSLSVFLQKKGIGKGDRVGIISHEHVEVYDHLYACLKIGAVRIGISWRFSPREILHIIRDSDIKVLIVQDNCIEKISPYLSELNSEGRILIGYGDNHGLDLDYGTLISNSLGNEPKWTEISENDLAVISYTSGTTGFPKGVMLTQSGVRDAAINTVLSWGLLPDDITFVPSPNAWIPFVHSIMNLTNGMTIVLPNGDVEPKRFLEFTEKYRITALLSNTPALQRIISEYEKGSYDISSIRLVTYGSTLTPVTEVKKFFEVFGQQAKIIDSYGCTELTGGWLTVLNHEDHVRGINENPELLISSGRTVPFAKIEIRDEENNSLSFGEIGNVWFKSPTNMVGYLNLPEKTAEVMRDGWIRTNDIGKVDKDGYLYLIDRKEDLIISGGLNVFPSNIETVIMEHEAVEAVIVTSVPHPKWGEAIIACVTIHAGYNLSENELVLFCRDRLAGFQIPKFFEILDDLPRAISGKLSRGAVRKMYENNSEKLPWNKKGER